MAFPDSVVAEAWLRSGGTCECTRSTHGHVGRCGARLDWGARGQEKYLASWEAHHITAGGPDTASNCEILCILCHVKTATYGG
jgi:hypothetical protein